MKGKLEGSVGGEVYITGLCTPLIAKHTAVVCALVDYFDYVTSFYHSSIVCPFITLSVVCLDTFSP